MPCRSLLLLSLIVISVTASGKDVPDKVTFEEHIKPIFRQHCVNCHHQGEKKGGLALDTFGSVIEGGGSGEVVFDDGSLDDSRLWQLVNHDDTPVMPPNQDKIPADQLALLQAWIEGGALENSGSKAKKKKNVLAFVATSGGKPEGPVAMPQTTPLATPVVTSRPAAVSAIATSPWAPLVAVAGQRQIVLYHNDTNELLGVLPFPEGVAQSLRFSRDGAYLVAGGGEHSVRGLVAIYDVKTGQRVATVGDELDTVFGADVNDTMSRVALGGPQKMLRIFDVADGSMLFDLKKHTDWIYSVAYSPDGVLIASGDRSGGLCVWEAETGRLYLDLVGHKAAVLSVSWRDDSNVLASASADGTVKLWEMNNGKAIRSINAHGGGAYAVDFDHQGRIASAGADNLAKLWDGNGKQLKTFNHSGEDMLEVAVSHDGKRVVYGDWSGAVLNASVDKPDQKSQLFSNPPPNEERAEVERSKLAEIQKQMAPAKATLDQALAAQQQAQKQQAELDQQIQSLRAEVEQNRASAKSLTDASTKISTQLPGLTLEVRDTQDLVTAARVALKANQKDPIAVAEAEEALAAKLIAIAKQRRERISKQKAAEEHVRIANAKTAEADQIAAKRKEHEKVLQQTQAAFAEAKSKFDQIQAEVVRIESRLSRLLAAAN